jgi:hypothetical protein
MGQKSIDTHRRPLMDAPALMAACCFHQPLLRAPASSAPRQLNALLPYAAPPSPCNVTGFTISARGRVHATRSARQLVGAAAPRVTGARWTLRRGGSGEHGVWLGVGPAQKA